MPEATWLLAAAAVAVASLVQTVTGAGLGLIAGPALLLAMASSDAILVAMVLNLALSLLLLPGELTHLPRRHLAWLAAGAALGAPLGAVALRGMDLAVLELLAGAAVLAGGVQMLRAPSGGGASAPPSLLAPGLLAGGMTAALAIPGPAALWGLSRTDLAADQVRAALRGFFALAYSATLLLHAVLGFAWGPVVSGSLWMAAPLLGGAALGVWARGRIGAAALRRAFVVLLLAMGTALLGGGVLHLGAR